MKKPNKKMMKTIVNLIENQIENTGLNWYQGLQILNSLKNKKQKTTENGKK